VVRGVLHGTFNLPASQIGLLRKLSPELNSDLEHSARRGSYKAPLKALCKSQHLFTDSQPPPKGSRTGYLGAPAVQVSKPCRETREQAGTEQAEARALVTLWCTENKVVEMLLSQHPHEVLVPINLLLPDDFPEALFKL